MLAAWDAASAWICKKIKNALSSAYQDLLGHLILTTSPWSILTWITLLSSVKSKQNILFNFCSLLRISELYPHFNDIYFFIFRENPAAHKSRERLQKRFSTFDAELSRGSLAGNLSKLVRTEVHFIQSTYKLLDQPLLKMIKPIIHFPSCAFRVV